MSGIICRTRRILKSHHELLECALPLGHGHPTPFGRPAEPKRGRGIGTKFHKLHVIHPSPLPPHVEQIWKQICEWFPCYKGSIYKRRQERHRQTMSTSKKVHKLCKQHGATCWKSTSKRVHDDPPSTCRVFQHQLQHLYANYGHVCQTTHTQRDRKGRWQGFRGM